MGQGAHFKGTTGDEDYLVMGRRQECRGYLLNRRLNTPYELWYSIKKYISLIQTWRDILDFF